ncbi:MAG: sodium:solute symporter family protein [Bacteroidota bacterium]
MHWIDATIFIVYMILMLGVGYYFLRKNKNPDDYFVGGRKMKSLHVGLSVVATDVGGGFSIGLGGLGFVMGIAGSWMLFTGLIGAWLTAVVLIPKVSRLSKKYHFYTFPQIFEHYYGRNVALLAGIISAIGYMGFTSSQILAGAKLASATFVNLDMTTALYLMGVIAVVYTVMGGLKAVIFTDTIQWIILMGGLIFIGIPIAFVKIGGMEAIRDTVSTGHLDLFNLTWQTFLNWVVTIIPIWFVGMTLYQRIYSTPDKKTAQRAWYTAGLFEYPVMAFMGVLLGLFSRVAVDHGMFTELGYATAEGLDSEKGLPLLLRTILPVGLMGLMMSAYFSAIMSTADSCLMASSGNIVTDIIGRFKKLTGQKYILRLSQIVTLIVGAFALWLASSMENVLNLMLYSYAFMVSGLFIPVLGAYYGKKHNPVAAITAMFFGGGTTLVLTVTDLPLPLDLDPNIFGITVSAIFFVVATWLLPSQNRYVADV